jgi:hypothetical protein
MRYMYLDYDKLLFFSQLLRECWSFLKKLMICQNLQNKLLNITVLFIWYLLASLKKMSLAKHGELYFILASICFSPLAILASVWKKWFPTLYGETCLNQSLKKTESCINLTNVPMVFELYKFKLTKFDCISI